MKKNIKSQLINVILLILLVSCLCACTKNKKEDFVETKKEAKVRTLTSSEQFQLNFELLAQYFNQNKRPKDKIVNNNESELYYLESEDGSQTWYYPEQEMSEEQLLQILDVKYGKVAKEWYTPAQDELSIKKIQEDIKVTLEKYYITDRSVDTAYILYRSAIPQNEGLPKDMQNFENVFFIALHMKDSEQDYQLLIEAKDGNLKSWKGMPKDSYTRAHFLETRMNRTAKSSIEGIYALSDEEIKMAAYEYIMKLGLVEGKLPQTIHLSKPIEDYLIIATIESAEGVKYDVLVEKASGNIYGLEIK